MVFEGIDGAGTSTQVPLLTARIKELSKYHDVLETHEPWQSEEIKRRLAEDEDAFADGGAMAALYVGDRAEHSRRLIEPNLQEGVFVLSDRYKMSTCAYQWAQGVELHRLLKMHEGADLVMPDVTFYLDVERETAACRLQGRGDALEKFEKDGGFIETLIGRYRSLARDAVIDESTSGPVVWIDGSRGRDEVAAEVREGFQPVYDDYLER